MECNSGSLTQSGYLLVSVCQRGWVLNGGLRNKPSAERSPWSSSEIRGLGRCGKQQGCLAGTLHERGKRRS